MAHPIRLIYRPLLEWAKRADCDHLYAIFDFWNDVTLAAGSYVSSRRCSRYLTKGRFMPQRSKFQEKAIKNYYDNREAIALQKVQEYVTELYLSEGKNRATYWKRIAGHLEKLSVDQKTIDHLISQDKPELVAALVKKLMDKQS